VISQWVTAFAERYSLDRLRQLEVDGDRGHLIRNDLRQAYEEFVEAMEGREVAALTAGARRGELVRFDPLAALSPGRSATTGHYPELVP
jgi:hypothetical protein